jgi:hypothetical protein
MSATLDKIIEEVRALSPEKQRQLRDVLDAPVRRAEATPVIQLPDRSREQQWIAAHRGEYVEQWVVVEGERLIAHGHDARTVYDAARDASIEAPFLIHVKPADELPFGGW